MNDLYDLTNPNPRALVESLRSVGYSLPTAIADIVDNSVSAEASEVHINFHWAGSESWISILDNGFGMSESGLKEAMRPGTKNPTDKVVSELLAEHKHFDSRIAEDLLAPHKLTQAYKAVRDGVRRAKKEYFSATIFATSPSENQSN